MEKDPIHKSNRKRKTLESKLSKKIVGTTRIESQSFTKILKRKIEYMETRILEWKI